MALKPPPARLPADSVGRPRCAETERRGACAAGTPHELHDHLVKVEEADIHSSEEEHDLRQVTHDDNTRDFRCSFFKLCVQVEHLNGLVPLFS